MFNILFLIALTLFILYKDMFSLLMFRKSVKTVCTYELEKTHKEDHPSKELQNYKDLCKMFTQ